MPVQILLAAKTGRSCLAHHSSFGSPAPSGVAVGTHIWLKTNPKNNNLGGNRQLYVFFWVAMWHQTGGAWTWDHAARPPLVQQHGLEPNWADPSVSLMGLPWVFHLAEFVFVGKGLGKGAGEGQSALPRHSRETAEKYWRVLSWHTLMAPLSEDNVLPLARKAVK